MPNFGQTTAESRIIAWHKREGDRVERGDVLAEVETDKANVPVESFTAGYLRRVLVPESTIATAGQAIALLTSTVDEPLEARESVHEEFGASAAPLPPAPSPLWGEGRKPHARRPALGSRPGKAS